LGLFGLRATIEQDHEERRRNEPGGLEGQLELHGDEQPAQKTLEPARLLQPCVDVRQKICGRLDAGERVHSLEVGPKGSPFGGAGLTVGEMLFQVDPGGRIEPIICVFG